MKMNERDNPIMNKVKEKLTTEYPKTILCQFLTHLMKIDNIMKVARKRDLKITTEVHSGHI